MSETTETTAPQGGDAAESEPAAPETEALAPADTGAATETEPTESERAAKRIARLNARYAGAARERDELAARLAQLEAAQRGDGQALDPNIEALVNQRADALAAEREAKRRADAFHDAGRDAYPDWADRCQALVAMGVDGPLSQMLVELKDGPKIAAALHDDPDALERIARLSTPTARALALGQFAAQVESRPAVARNVTRAPAPIRPVTGRVQPTFNEHSASMDQLIEHYSKQAQEARTRR